MAGERFHAYVSETLVPTLRLGDTPILANLGAYTVAAVREAIEAAGPSSCTSHPTVWVQSD